RHQRAGKFGLSLSAALWLLCIAAGIYLAGHPDPSKDPKAQALAYYKALSQQDWKSVYKLTAFSPRERAVYQGADSFARILQRSLDQDPASKHGYDKLRDLTEISVGEPIFHDIRADVPTSSKL